jgi:hypothetical protein
VPEIDAHLDEVKVHVALPGKPTRWRPHWRRSISPRGAEFNDSDAAATASRGSEDGADAGSDAADYSGDVDYSSDGVEARSAGQDAAEDQAVGLTDGWGSSPSAHGPGEPPAAGVRRSPCGVPERGTPLTRVIGGHRRA